MQETTRDEVHQCEGCHNAMGPVVLFLCLSTSAGCCLVLGFSWSRLHVMQESVPSADRGNPSSPRVGLVTNKDRSTITFLKQS